MVCVDLCSSDEDWSADKYLSEELDLPAHQSVSVGLLDLFVRHSDLKEKDGGNPLEQTKLQ